jgi:hypothetical protein
MAFRRDSIFQGIKRIFPAKTIKLVDIDESAQYCVGLAVALELWLLGLGSENWRSRFECSQKKANMD